MTTLNKQIHVKTFLPGRASGLAVDCGSHLLPIQHIKATKVEGCFSRWSVIDDPTTEEFAQVGNRLYQVGPGNIIYIHQRDVNLLPKNKTKAKISVEFSLKFAELSEAYQKALAELDNVDE